MEGKSAILCIILVLFLFAGCMEETPSEPPEGENRAASQPEEELQEGPEYTEPEEAEVGGENLNLPEHCKDGIYNEGEEGLDCGWSCPSECVFTEKYDVIPSDETWSGNIKASFVFVPDWVTITIEPGTVVKFTHSRDYRNFEKGAMYVRGTVTAIGTQDKQIWFTSDAPEPVNGDWWGISLENSSESIFEYVIVEFGEMGIEQFDSEASISNSIIRWNNAEGLYAERSKPIFEYNTLYGNGYHEIALEQYNEVIIRNNYFHDGVCAIHNEKTNSTITGNYFDGYKWPAITAGMESELTIDDNVFLNIPHDQPYNIYDGSIAEIGENMIDEPTVSPPQFDYEDTRNFEIHYIPGDENDLYPYIYAEEDQTRRTLKKIGEGLGFGWALVYADGSLYRFSIGDGEVGESLDFIKINPDTGEYEKFGNNEIMNPRGLTWDGEYFWVNDFSLLRIYKFKLDGDYIEILDSFDIPEKEEGGTIGLTSDGEYLYLRSRTGDTLSKLDKEGNLIEKIHFERGIGGAIVWAGEYFWTSQGCSKGICKFTKEGKLAGEIYPAAKDTWALAWDGACLWSIQRTSETWSDPKIYQIEILDDTLGPQWD